MEILGIGASELVFVIIIALIVLGPKDMQKAGRTIGKWLRTIVTSDGWRAFQKTSNELRNLPARMMRDANEELEKFNRDVRAGMDIPGRPANPSRPDSRESKPASGPDSDVPPSEYPENTILPHSAETDSDDISDSQKNG